MIGQGHGQSAELFFVDGRSDGMVTATIFNWTGHLLVTSRAQAPDAVKRAEACRTGVYLLLGEGEDGRPRLYIGEGEDVSDRIHRHQAEKGWWTRMVLVTSAENSLNKAHVKYLEARLIELARAVGRVELDNANGSSRPSLTEAATANMENFIEYLLVLLPAVRIDCFVDDRRKSGLKPAMAVAHDKEAAVRAPVEFELATPRHALRAFAVLENGEFVVQAGSSARAQWMGKGSEESSYARLHAELRRSGVLADDGDRCVFQVSYAFNSPSAAGAVVNGRPTNGTMEWKVKGTEITYKEWEARQWGDADAVYETSLADALQREVQSEVA